MIIGGPFVTVVVFQRCLSFVLIDRPINNHHWLGDPSIYDNWRMLCLIKHEYIRLSGCCKRKRRWSDLSLFLEVSVIWPKIVLWALGCGYCSKRFHIRHGLNGWVNTLVYFHTYIATQLVIYSPWYRETTVEENSSDFHFYERWKDLAERIIQTFQRAWHVSARSGRRFGAVLHLPCSPGGFHFVLRRLLDLGLFSASDNKFLAFTGESNLQALSQKTISWFSLYIAMF